MVALVLGLVASGLLVVLAAVHTRRLVIGVSVVLSVVVAAQYCGVGGVRGGGRFTGGAGIRSGDCVYPPQKERDGSSGYPHGGMP